MTSIKNKVIHRFICPISDYEEGGVYYNQVIPLDTQAYAFYPEEDDKYGLWFVLGDGDHTYVEIRDGKGNKQSAKEYPVYTDLIDAIHIKYINEDYSFTNVKEALDYLLYITPEVKLYGGDIYERGTILNTVNLYWTINKKVKEQFINNGIGMIDKDLRSYTVENANITEDITYTITVDDKQNTATSSTDILFRDYIYYGESDKDEEALTNQDILNFSKNFEVLKTDKVAFDCSGGKYFYFVVPRKYRSKMIFKINGFIFSDMIEKNIVLTNSKGLEQRYTIFRSNNLQHGSDIEVRYIISDSNNIEEEENY